MRLLRDIAAEILTNWSRPNGAALPFIKAMSELDSLSDTSGLEDGSSAVQRFLVNAQTWRGETAVRVKAELKQGLKEAGIQTG